MSTTNLPPCADEEDGLNPAVLAALEASAVHPVSSPSHEVVTMREVFRLWLPLSVSFVLMTFEGPSLQSAIGRLPHPQLNLAAWGLTIGLSLLVESPVIMLLATSIALVSDAAAYRMLRSFTLLLCFACTALTAAVAFTPLYHFVTERLMHQPEEIRVAARPALAIMLLWSAAIGYRRFYQGVMVRYGQAKKVSWGTAVRLGSLLSMAAYLVGVGGRSGVEVAAIAIMTGVITEAVVTWIFARPVVAEKVLTRQVPCTLTFAAVWRFHGPLAATTLLTLLVEPLNAAALGLLPHPHKTLAAWPVAFMTVFVIRGWSFALQEVSVALAGRRSASDALTRFTWIVGSITSSVAALVAFTPLLRVYLDGVLHTPLNLEGLIQVSVGICFLQPLFTALGALTRGMLMAAGATSEVYKGMGMGLAAQILLLLVTVPLRLPGMWVAATASLGATVVEFGYLRLRAKARGLV